MSEINNQLPAEVLEGLIRYYDRWQWPALSLTQKVQVYSGAALDWVGDFVTDTAISWENQEIRIDDLYLVGTNPAYNPIVIEKAERSAAKIRELLKTDPETQALFTQLKPDDTPILIRIDQEKSKVLMGMFPILLAIREGKETISAYVGAHTEAPKPHCEPHVVYDLMRAYERGHFTDRAALVVALTALIKTYDNIRELVTNRLGPNWVQDSELRSIIDEVLKKTEGIHAK